MHYLTDKYYFPSRPLWEMVIQEEKNKYATCKMSCSPSQVWLLHNSMILWASSMVVTKNERRNSGNTW